MASRILADEWNIWILAYALGGARRFGDWKRPGAISNATLTAGLTNLTELGLLDRVRYLERPERFEYHLTVRGTAVWHALVWVWAWEREWSVTPRPTVDIVHCCAAVLVPRLECAGCRAPVAGRDLVMQVGPSGGWTRSIPTVANRRRAPRPGSASELLPEVMTMIGDRWSWAVLGAAFRGVTRYSEFTSFLGGPAPTISDRLRSFCGIGVLVAVPDGNRAGWFDYRLTTKGRAFLPVVLATVEWGQRFYRSPEGIALDIRHGSCGARFEMITVCSGCGVDVVLDDLSARPGGPPTPGDHG